MCECDSRAREIGDGASRFQEKDQREMKNGRLAGNRFARAWRVEAIVGAVEFSRRGNLFSGLAGLREGRIRVTRPFDL